MKYKLVILFFLFSILACKENYIQEEKEESGKEAKLQPVNILDLEVTSEPIPLMATGVLGSESELNLSFKIGGIIEKVYVKESQYVKKEQVIAAIRATEIDAHVKKANQAMTKATRDVDRIKKMYADTVATLEQVEDLETRLEIAKSDVEIAMFNLENTKIVSPVSGRILKKFLESNELVSPGVPVVKIASNEGRGFLLKIGVADKDVIRIKRGDLGELTLDAYPNQVFKTYVTDVAEVASPLTGTFKVELGIDKPKGLILKNGFIGKVKLFPSIQKPYYKIDMEALVEGYKNKANVYIPDLNNDTLRAKRIKVIPEHIGPDYFTVSEEQLVGIERIISKGAAYLKDGAKIKIIE